MTANYAYYPVYFDGKVFGKTRDQVFEELAERGFLPVNIFILQ